MLKSLFKTILLLSLVGVAWAGVQNFTRLAAEDKPAPARVAGEERKPTAATATPARKPESAPARDPGKKAASKTRFVPTEKLRADDTVAFPVDI